jgi:enoyl-CoA hydratase
MTEEKSVLYEVKDRVAYITLNQPERKNSLSRRLCGELHEAWLAFEEDPEVRTGIITGTENIFCSGMDVDEIGEEFDPGIFITLDSAMPSYALSSTKPIIAAINGWAIGAGFGLCVACDLRVASEKARFSFPEARVGLCGGGLDMLNVMDTTVAVEMMLTGQPIDAQRAYEAGLLNRVVPHEKLMEEAQNLADSIKDNAPLTMKMLKAFINEHQKTLMQQWKNMYHTLIMPQIESRDWKEGIAAFREKRPPHFRGE